MTSKRRNNSEGGGGGDYLDLGKTFPNDLESQEIWTDIYDPLQRKMKQMFLDGVELPSDLAIPLDTNTLPWGGFREREDRRNYQQWVLYYQCWCVEKLINKFDSSRNVADTPYILGFAGINQRLKSIGLNHRNFGSATARMRGLIYERIRTRKEIFRSKEFETLMLSEYHIGHYLWASLYGRNQTHVILEKTDETILSKQIEELEDRINSLGATERTGIVRQRIGQEIFRVRLMEYWGRSCAVSGLACEQILRASHAKPWKDCETDKERLTVYNGLLLAPHLDALFDSGLMTIEDTGAVILSTQLTDANQKILSVSGNLGLRRKLDPEHLPFLEWHRQKVFKK